MERYTFEATILLSFLANFHRSDAAKLNPYLQHIRDTSDTELMRKICWAANFACDAAVRYTRAASDVERKLKLFAAGHSQSVPGDLRRFDPDVCKDDRVVDHISETRSRIVLATPRPTARDVQKPVSA